MAAAVMMRIAKLPRKVEQAPLYEIESAWNEEESSLTSNLFHQPDDARVSSGC